MSEALREKSNKIRSQEEKNWIWNLKDWNEKQEKNSKFKNIFSLIYTGHVHNKRPIY